MYCLCTCPDGWQNKTKSHEKDIVHSLRTKFYLIVVMKDKVSIAHHQSSNYLRHTERTCQPLRKRTRNVIKYRMRNKTVNGKEIFLRRIKENEQHSELKSKVFFIPSNVRDKKSSSESHLSSCLKGTSCFKKLW